MKKFRFLLPLVIATLLAIPFSANAEDGDAVASPPDRERRSAGSRQTLQQMSRPDRKEPRKVEVIIDQRKVDPAVIKAEVEARQARRAAQLARERAQIARERAQLAQERAQLAQERAEAANQRLRDIAQKTVRDEKGDASKNNRSPEAPLRKREENQKRIQEVRQGEGRNEARGRDGRPVRKMAEE